MTATSPGSNFNQQGGSIFNQRRQSCAQFPVSDWKQEVEAGDTILGYWEWVIAQAEANGVDLDLLYGGAGKLAALERFAEMFDWSEEEARHARENINNTYGDECVVASFP